MLRILTIGAWIAAIAAFTGVQFIHDRHVDGLPFWRAMMITDYFTASLAGACLLASVGALLMGAVALAARRAGRPTRELGSALIVTAAGAAAAGALGAVWGELMTQAALQGLGPIAFEVTAPSRAQSLMSLALGLLAAATALTGALVGRGGTSPGTASAAV